MSNGPKRYLRHRFWINTQIQGRFVVFYLVACALISALMTCTVFAVVWSQLSEFISVSHLVNPQEVFLDIFTGTLLAAGALFLLCALAGSLVLTFVSHRVAGPVHRIRKALSSIQESPSHRLRSGDALQDVYAKVCLLQEQNSELSRRHGELVSAMGELCDQLSRDEQGLEESMSTLEKLRELMAGAAEEGTSA